MIKVEGVKIHKVTTIVISLAGGNLLDRIRYALWFFPEPWFKFGNLNREYKVWNASGILDSFYHRFRYIVDHFLLWYFYCLIAAVRGQAEGASWQVDDIAFEKLTAPGQFFTTSVRGK